MIISCDDGCASDVRLAELCNKYEIDCTFYWPVEMRSLAYANGYKPLSHYDAQQIADNFTVNSHSITHRHLTKIPFEEAIQEIADSKKILESIYSIEIDSFCFPRGYTNDELNKVVLDSGYTSYRLTKGLDHEGNKLVHVHPKSGANDERPWRECITENTHLWLHSFDLDRHQLWDELEEVLHENY